VQDRYQLPCFGVRHRCPPSVMAPVNPIG
jgi:hypothetical protein